MRHSPPGDTAPGKADAAISSVDAALSSLSIGKPTRFGGLATYPLTSDLSSSARYILLEEGLSQGLVSVEEVDKGGSVPDLVVRNRSESHVLIVDGEELVGAKQNRIANLTLLVPARRDTIIPVSCVEAGRWSYNRRDFGVSERVQNRDGRAQRLRSVHTSMRDSGSRRSDQGAVWDGIREKAVRMAAESPTEAMGDIYDKHRTRLDGYVGAISPLPGQVGAVFVVRGRHFGLDVFDKPETFAAFLPKLVRSYGIDAMEQRMDMRLPDTAANARAFLDRLRDGSFDAHRAVALGHDVGVVARGAIAGALVHEETTLHLTAFSERTHAEEPRPGPYASYRQRRESLRRRRTRE